MARIKAAILIPAYMNASRPYEVEAYLTREDSRFAVAKEHKGWSLRHRASGMGLWSLLPGSSAHSLADLLNLIRAWEAHTEIDLSPLDNVTFGKGFNSPPPPALLQSLREISAATLQAAA